MNEEDLQELMRDCPKLYHMAERGAWEGIRQYGLLSTSALLDLYGVCGKRRVELESRRRNAIVSLRSGVLPIAKLRDQRAMDDRGLEKCLQDGITPRQWYERLNAMVFFWLTEDRLHRLSGARAYRSNEREVLVLRTKDLVAAYRDSVWLCPMNSGATKPRPHSRGASTFSRICNYPYRHWRQKRPSGKRVVELCVDEGVADVTRMVERVYVIKGVTFVSDLEV